MIYKTIQGVNVPALGFGTYRLTGRACRRGVADAIEIGYRHIDTAQVYGNEGQVGDGLHDAGIDRSEVFLTTKVWMDSLEPRRVRSSFEESLSKLRTEYVDLLLIHWPAPDMHLGETLGAMRALMEEGKTRHVGVSNFTVDLLGQAARHAPIFCNQVEYHPYLGQAELLDFAAEHDVLLTAYSPIARGKVLRDETLQELASAHGKTPVQVTLRWLIQQDKVAAIPKASSSDHRRENFELFDFELSNDDMDRIAALHRGDRIVDPSWAPAW